MILVMHKSLYVIGLSCEAGLAPLAGARGSATAAAELFAADDFFEGLGLAEGGCV